MAKRERSAGKSCSVTSDLFTMGRKAYMVSGDSEDGTKMTQYNVS